jgi:hypothetical protein
MNEIKEEFWRKNSKNKIEFLSNPTWILYNGQIDIMSSASETLGNNASGPQRNLLAI